MLIWTLTIWFNSQKCDLTINNCDFTVQPGGFHSNHWDLTTKHGVWPTYWPSFLEYHGTNLHKMGPQHPSFWNSGWTKASFTIDQMLSFLLTFYWFLPWLLAMRISFFVSSCTQFVSALQIVDGINIIGYRVDDILFHSCGIIVILVGHHLWLYLVPF